MIAEFEASIAQHETFFAGILAVSLVFYALIILETVYDLAKGRRKSWRETLANFAIELGNRLLDNTIVAGLFVIALLWAGQFAFASIPMNALTWALAILAADFTYYWMHRVEHERRILWAYHSAHHSSQEYNLTTSLRLAWVEGLFEWLFFVPMALVGFDLVQILGALLVVLVYQTWIHTEKIGRLGWLEGIFNTPSVHRVHHATNAHYIDKNYGGILIIWDRLFGTYQPEEERPNYGLTEQLGTSNPLAINFREFGAIAADVRRAGSLKEALGYVFGRPGWKPNNSAKTKPANDAK